jgi:hypothetical protein
MERADLVEAQWRAHGIRNTVLVTFDYSSLVMLELLQHQRDERVEKGMSSIRKNMYCPSTDDSLPTGIHIQSQQRHF